MVFVVVFVWSMYRTSGWAYVPSIFTRMPGESYRQRLRSLLLCLFDVFRALVNSVVCRFNLCPGYAKRKKRERKKQGGGGGGGGLPLYSPRPKGRRSYSQAQARGLT